jgi:hypothetical protein
MATGIAKADFPTDSEFRNVYGLFELQPSLQA